jgi:DNA-binding SARP family transcriptional activator
MGLLTPTLAPVRLDLLGGFRLTVEASVLTLPLNAQRLLSFLALQDRPLLRSFVAGSLWGDAPDRRASGSLRSALWRLGHPRHPLVSTSAEHIELDPAVEVDVRRAQQVAHRVLDRSLPLDRVVDRDEEILSADLLPDWTEEWVLVERERYHQLRLRALETLCDRLSDAHRSGQAVQAGLAAVAGEPLRESAWRSLIRAHLSNGNVAAARREYQAFETLLRNELGLSPSDELSALVSST